MAAPLARTQRLHALDSLRAVMMLLGLVLHSAINYAVVDVGEAWPFKDRASTHPLFDLLVGLIHAFRMPVFFVVAGFFGALLFYEKSPRAMVTNRLARVLYPFLVFVLLLWPAVVFAFTFSGAAAEGAASPWGAGLAPFSSLWAFLPFDTMHLWFLYYLVFYSFAGWGLGALLQRAPALARGLARLFTALTGPPLLRPLFFAAPTFVLLYLMDTPWAEKTGGFLPAWKPLLLYFVFYVFGWFLYAERERIAGTARFAWLWTAVATLAFLVKGPPGALPTTAVMGLNALLVWGFVFGLTGLFVRYGSAYSARMRWVSDASYWFYLVHLPLTAFFPGLLVGTGLPALAKFALVLGATSLCCWLSYTYLVRSTSVGLFLNGRKYPRGTPEAATTAQAPGRG